MSKWRFALVVVVIVGVLLGFRVITLNKKLSAAQKLLADGNQRIEKLLDSNNSLQAHNSFCGLSEHAKKKYEARGIKNPYQFIVQGFYQHQKERRDLIPIKNGDFPKAADPVIICDTVLFHTFLNFSDRVGGYAYYKFLVGKDRTIKWELMDYSTMTLTEYPGTEVAKPNK